MDSWIKENKEESKDRVHQDYARNLWFCRQFIKNSENKLPNGMRIRVGNSDHKQETIVQITYQDPKFGSKNPSQGITINLNQPHKSGIDTPIMCFFEEFGYAYLQISNKSKMYTVDVKEDSASDDVQEKFW